MDEELKEKIADIIDREDKNSFALPCMDIANQILTLIREAGYEPPESVREMVEASYKDGIDDTEQKYKGWKSPEEVEKRIEMILGGNNK